MFYLAHTLGRCEICLLNAMFALLVNLIKYYDRYSYIGMTCAYLPMQLSGEAELCQRSYQKIENGNKAK